jgi:endoglucanase
VAVAAACGGSTPPASSTPTPAATPHSGAPRLDVVHRQGAGLVLGEDARPIRLRGVCFGNEVWGNPSVPPSQHHDETDLGRVQAMNMNAIRFYMNYGLFESDWNPYVYRQSAWDWLDTNVRWARAHGIYLILNMHVPQGGFQSLGEGTPLWDVPENQMRLRALWKAIAERYADEPTIAGYDLVNEPIASRSLDQWRTLAQELVRDIRSVDPSHLIVVERLNGIKGDWPTYGQPNFFLLDDPNVMYEFHVYSPIEYSHQGTSWTGLPEDGAYPEPGTVEPPADITWKTATFENPELPAGDSAWAYYEGRPFTVTDSSLLAGKPVFGADNADGTAYFDDIVITEHDAGGAPLREIVRLNVASLDGWGFWSANGAGTMALAEGQGHGDTRSLAISGTTSYANAYNDALRFAVTPGHSYVISGWMKGRSIGAGADCRLRIDFEWSPSGKPLHVRDRAYLASVVDDYLAFGREHGVPMYVGEYGLYRRCYAAGKGGMSWVADLVGLLRERDLSFTYHAYHEDAFGIYRNSTGLPDPAQANTELIDFFRRTLP